MISNHSKRTTQNHEDSNRTVYPVTYKKENNPVGNVWFIHLTNRSRRCQRAFYFCYFYAFNHGSPQTWALLDAKPFTVNNAQFTGIKDKEVIESHDHLCPEITCHLEKWINQLRVNTIREGMLKCVKKI